MYKALMMNMIILICPINRQKGCKNEERHYS